MLKRFSACLLGCLVFAGCSSSPGTQTSKSPVPSQSSSQVPLETASDYANALMPLIPSVQKIVVFTENNDPNNLIGRPNGYESAATMFDERLKGSRLGVDDGATVEVYKNSTAARARFKYIDGIQKSIPSIHDYMILQGNVLFRISGDLKPSQYDQYEAAFHKITGKAPDSVA